MEISKFYEMLLVLQKLAKSSLQRDELKEKMMKKHMRDALRIQFENLARLIIVDKIS